MGRLRVILTAAVLPRMGQEQTTSSREGGRSWRDQVVGAVSQMKSQRAGDQRREHLEGTADLARSAVSHWPEAEAPLSDSWSWPCPPPLPPVARDTAALPLGASPVSGPAHSVQGRKESKRVSPGRAKMVATCVLYLAHLLLPVNSLYRPRGLP